MAEEPQEIPQEKKIEYKTIYLFGKKISVEYCSSLESNETAMPLVNVPTSPAKDADHEDLKTSRNPNLQITCARIKTKKTLKKRRNPKKMRYLPKEEREEEKQTEPWTIKKTLLNCDIGTNSRLMVATKDAERYLNIHLSVDAQKRIQQGVGVELQIYDHDTNTEHRLIYKRHPSSKNYIFNGDWMREFVKRRLLKIGDTVGFFWGADSRLHFSVLFRCFL